MKKKILLPLVILVLLLSLCVVPAIPAVAANAEITLTMSAEPVEVCDGGSVDLTIVLTNTGTYYDVDDITVTVGAPLNVPLPSQGDGVLETGETWMWILTTTVTQSTTFSASALAYIIPCRETRSDCAEATVTVVPCPPPTECGPCEGGVTTLTFRYNGGEPADIVVMPKKGHDPLFDAAVGPGETFTVNGADKKGKLGTEIKIFVNGEEYAKIHTSCSQPIGIGMVIGDFEIVGGESLKGGALCPIPDTPDIPQCGECEGGVTTLTFRYNGDATADIVVMPKKGDNIFDAAVSPGETFTVNGADKKGKLGTEIKIFVNGEEYAKIHTSCSQPIGIGMVIGDFEIVGGESLKGGTLPSIN